MIRLNKSVWRHVAAMIVTGVLATIPSTARAQFGGFKLPSPPKIEAPKAPKINLPKPPKINVPKPPVSLPKPPKINFPKPPVNVPKPPKINVPKPPTIKVPPVSLPKPPTVKLPPINFPKPPTVKLPPINVPKPPTVKFPPVNLPKPPTVKLPPIHFPKPPTTVKVPPFKLPKPPTMNVPLVNLPKPPTVKLPGIKLPPIIVPGLPPLFPPQQPQPGQTGGQVVVNEGDVIIQNGGGQTPGNGGTQPLPPDGGQGGNGGVTEPQVIVEQDPGAAKAELAASIINLVGAGIQAAAINNMVQQPIEHHHQTQVPVMMTTPVMTSDVPLITSTTQLPPALPMPTAPTRYSYLVVNASAQPVTYSIRAAGTQWGTYTLATGKHHEYDLTHAEMELKFTTITGESVQSLPGDHNYAFADGENGLAIYLADAATE